MAWVPVTDWNTVEHNTRARDADGNEGTLYGFHTYTQLGTTGRPHWDGHYLLAYDHPTPTTDAYWVEYRPHSRAADMGVEVLV